MALLFKKSKDQKRKDEYNKSFARAKRDHGGTIPANFPSFANWKNNFMISMKLNLREK